MRVDEFEQLWNFNDGGCTDDPDAEAFGDGEFEAFGVRGIDVEEERLVACGADEGGTEVCDGLWQVVRNGLEDRAEGVHAGGDCVAWDIGDEEWCCLGNFWLRALT